MVRPFVLLFIGWLFVSSATAQTIRYVKPGATSIGLSWEFASGDLAQMLRLSNPGDEVWVAAGTFVPLRDPSGSTAPSDPRTKTFFVKSGVKVYGGFVGTETSLSGRPNVIPAINPSSTTLSGDLEDPGDPDDNTYHVVSMGASTTATVVDGFVITRGNANGSGDGNKQSGGGLFLQSPAAATIQPILQNLVVTNNQAALSGGGLFGASVGGLALEALIGICSPTILNCRFVLNRAQTGGGLALLGTGITVQNTLFDRNTATTAGGGVAIIGGGSQNTTGRMDRCMFTGNVAPFGGGLQGLTVEESTRLSLQLSRCTFESNRAEGLPPGGFIPGGSSGGGILLGNPASESGSLIDALVQNCLITGNSAVDQGGGVLLTYGQSLTIINSTLSGNLADKGGAIATQPANGDKLLIHNSILFANVGVSGRPTLYVVGSSFGGGTIDLTENLSLTNYLQLRFSDVQQCSAIGGCSISVGNFDEDPLFTTPGFYTLQANSPCINAGDATSTNATVGTIDVAGNARIQSSVIDVGAFESVFPLTTIYTIRPGIFEDASNWSCQCAPSGQKTVVGHSMSLPTGASVRTTRFRRGGTIQMGSTPTLGPSRLILTGPN